MMKRLIGILFVCGALASCATNAPNKTASGAAQAGESAQEQANKRLINPGEFVAQSRQSMAQSASMGPKLSEPAEARFRDGARVRIAEDVPKAYLEVGEPKNVFNVSMAFNQVSMLAVAQMLSEVTGVNILVGDEVQKNLVTAKLMNVPWNKGLDAILKTKGLAKDVDLRSNIIRIHDQATLVALEDFERKRDVDLRTRLEIKRSVEPQYTEMFRLFYASPEKVKAEILSVLKGSEKEDAKKTDERSPQVTIDGRVNSLIVKATRQELDLVSSLIEKVDVRTEQVLIEAFIVEATDDFGKELGARLGLDRNGTNSAGDRSFQLAGSLPSATASVGTSLGGFVSNLATDGAVGGIGVLFKTSTSALRAELFAMEQSGLSRLVSNPRIFTLDGESAVVTQGEEISYQGPADQSGNSTVQFKKVELKLEVTPQIIGDGNISLKVKVTKDTANRSQASATGVPPIDSRSVDTKLLVKNQSIAVIGGVFNQEESNSASKVPGLGDIPVLGHLFRKDVKKDVRKELLIFLAPRVL